MILDFKCPEYTTIIDIKNKFGNDLRKIDLTDVFFMGDLRDTKLPDDKNLFQKIIYKNLSGVIMPEKDYSNYNFEGVVLAETKFTKNSILPKDRFLFQNIKKKDLYNTKLPEGDYSKYEFLGVSISHTKFTKNSILPKNKNLFKNCLFGITGTALPEADYSHYDFSGVNFINTIFTKKSKLPEDKDLFQKIYDKSLNYTILPEGDYSLYNFNDVSMLTTVFRKNSSLPKDYSFFKKLLLYNSKLILPKETVNELFYYDIDYINDRYFKYLDENKKFLLLNKKKFINYGNI